MDVSSELPPVIDALSGMQANIYQAFRGISLSGRSSSQRVFLLSFSSFYFTYSTCLSLMRAKFFLQLPLALRSVLESYVDIINISNDEKYAEMMLYNIHKKRLRFLTEQSKVGRDENETKREISQLNDVLRGFENKNIKTPSWEKRFLDAGAKTYYYTVYRHYSGFVHNDFNVILSADGGDEHCFLDLHRGDKPEENMQKAYLHILFCCMCEIAFAAANYIGGHDASAFASFCSDAEKLGKRLGCPISYILHPQT